VAKLPMSTITPLPVSALKLDPENPRLPESVQGGAQSVILRHLFENDALDEIAQSYVDNGFFPHEPLIVLDRPDKRGRRSVLEGNRRLATLMILLGAPEAEGLSFQNIEPTRDDLKALSAVPCFQIPTRDEVHAYLGFRHIGGIKTWEPEAKARYLLIEIDKARRTGSDDPFKDVGRRVGSNALGVRNPYIALSVLRFAQEEWSLDSKFVQHERFGVWQRSLNSPEIREYIGFGDARTYSEVQSALQDLKKRQLAEVLGDFKPRPGKLKPVLGDSRDVTDYGRVIADDGARALLRSTGDLSLAAQVLSRADLSSRIARVTATCKVLLEEFHQGDIDEDAVQAMKDLHGVVRTMWAAARQGSDD
jgi:hypothetical protein